MASEANRALLQEAGLATHEVEAGPNDLLIAIEADTSIWAASSGSRAIQREAGLLIGPPIGYNFS